MPIPTDIPPPRGHNRQTRRSPRRHGHRLRTGRYSEAGRIYHLTTATHGRNPRFTRMTDARVLIQAMRRFHAAGDVESLAFVVMPDHLHWLVTLGEATTLARFMSRFKAVSARDLNRIHRQAGQPVWQRGYYDHALRCNEDLRAVARYIIANPLRAGLVERIGDYPHWDAIWL